MPSLPNAQPLSQELPRSIREQLSNIPSAHLDTLVSLVLEAISNDPSIDFLLAVKALWRCTAYAPPSTPAATPTMSAALRTEDKGATQLIDHDIDTDMPDAPPYSLPKPQSQPQQPDSSTSTAKLPGRRSLSPAPTSSTPSKGTHPMDATPRLRKEGQNCEVITATLRDRNCTGAGCPLSWQQREQLALTQAYLQAFRWWPHSEKSEKQCKNFLMKYCVL